MLYLSAIVMAASVAGGLAAHFSVSTAGSCLVSSNGAKTFASWRDLRVRGCKNALISRNSVGSSRLSSRAKQFGGRTGEGSLGLVVRAGAENEVYESKGLSDEGPGRGGQWLSSTTRHVRIYIGVADPRTLKMDQQQLDKVTLMLDPDNEFLWPEDKVQKVYDYFAELVEGYAGAPCTEYTLRLIGSDVEHYIRKLLLANEIKYNLDCRVLNFSMGKPRYVSGIVDG